MKTIWIHIPEGLEPRVLQVGTRPRQPGPVYEVKGQRTRVAAENAVRLGTSPEPDVSADALRWARWKEAAEAIRLVKEEEFCD